MAEQIRKIYGSKTDEEAKLATKELKDVPKENIKDGIGEECEK